MKEKIATISDRTQKLILIMFILILPVGMVLRPPPSFYGLDLPDGIAEIRGLLILLAGIGALLSIICSISYLFASPRKVSTIVVQCAISLFSIVLAFRYFPYCVNGIFQAYLEGAKIIDFYPDKMILWFGTSGSYMVIMYLIVYLGGATLFIATLLLKQRRKIPHNQSMLVFTLLAAICLTYIFSPHLEKWMFD